jgi:hypothetical protein
VTFDSTLISFDSDLTTWDGAYLGELQTVWIAPRAFAATEIDARITATMEIG